MLCLAYSQAQSIKIIYNGNQLNNGDTVTIKAEGDRDVLPTGQYYYEAEFMPSIRNTSPVNCTVRIKAEKLNNSATFVKSVCAGLCVDDSISLPFTLNMNSTYEGAYMHFAVPEEAEMGLFKFSITDTNNANNTAYVILKVFNNTYGIEQASLNANLNAYPNPATTSLTLDYQMDAQRGEVVVIDMVGRTVLSQPVEGNQGSSTVDISNLPLGVYLYGIKADNRISSMKKLLKK